MERIKRPHDSPDANPAWEDTEVKAAIALAMERKVPDLARAIAPGCWGGFRRGIAYAKTHKHPELRDRTVWEVFEEERPQLVP